MARFRNIRDAVLRVRKAEIGTPQPPLRVADIGCGAGAQASLWEELGHRVLGLDVNQALVEIARERAAASGLGSEFWVGSATDLPWPDQSVDVCLLPELLEHVPEWERCLDEACRVLARGGVLFLSTTNRLCPVQQEFRLPAYSWYPGPIKRWCVGLAKGRAPWIAGYATYPAVNWFTPGQLRRALESRGFNVWDRFAFTGADQATSLKAGLLGAIRKVAPLRALALAATPYSSVIGVRR